MSNRYRGWFLTDKGLNKLRTAIRERYPDERPSFTAISAQTDRDINPQAGEFVSKDVISNIYKQRAKAERNSIDLLFKAFGLTVENDDLTRDAPYTPTPSAEPIFVGREADLTELDRRVKAGEKAIQIVAAGGIGKTRFVREYLKRFGDRVLEFNMALESQGVVPPSGVVEKWLIELGEEPGREFWVSMDRLRKKLQEAKSKIAIFIDNLEPTLQDGFFIGPYKLDYVALFRVLAGFDVKSVTLITSRELLHEPYFTVHTYKLEGLDLKAWQEYFSSRGVATDRPSLEKMRDAYNGNAKAMEVLCGAILQDYDGDLDVYWQENSEDLLRHPTLEQLVTKQFDRLEQTNPNAYNLLCRLGCYRYQDVPLVPKEGVLCLLWDVPTKPLRVLDALTARCLLDVPQKQQYRLHPAIRQVAIERLRDNTEDCEKANRQAAEFWTESVETVVTVDDAIRALEAYYHYVEIEDFNCAGDVITNYHSVSNSLDKNKVSRSEPLYMDLWRLGLLQIIVDTTSKIIEKPLQFLIRSRLYVALGYTQNLLGQLNQAMEYHQQSKKLAFEYLIDRDSTKVGNEIESYNDAIRLQSIALHNIGCCQFDLFEIKKSLKIFEEFQSFVDSNKLQKHLVDSYYGLALIYSILNDRDKARYFMNLGYSKLSVTKWSAWSQGYALLFLALTHKNLEESDRAFEMFNEAIEYAEQVNYRQVRAKALTGLGELYRIQGDFAKAIPLHQESIEILDKICAKCDLAEAYFQCALTYQAMGEADKSQQNFDAALKLFGEIDAPKQIERVQQAMNPA